MNESNNEQNELASVLRKLADAVEKWEASRADAIASLERYAESMSDTDTEESVRCVIISDRTYYLRTLPLEMHTRLEEAQREHRRSPHPASFPSSKWEKLADAHNTSRSKLLDVLALFIDSIDGYEKSPREYLNRLLVNHFNRPDPNHHFYVIVDEIIEAALSMAPSTEEKK